MRYLFFEEELSMVTMNVSLPGPLKSWVEAQVKSGRYGNASDYVRDLIRRDQEQQTAISEIQELVDEGLASGEARSFDAEAFLVARRAA